MRRMFQGPATRSGSAAELLVPARGGSSEILHAQLHSAPAPVTGQQDDPCQPEQDHRNTATQLHAAPAVVSGQQDYSCLPETLQVHLQPSLAAHLTEQHK